MKSPTNVFIVGYALTHQIIHTVSKALYMFSVCFSTKSNLIRFGKRLMKVFFTLYHLCRKCSRSPTNLPEQRLFFKINHPVLDYKFIFGRCVIRIKWVKCEFKVLLLLFLADGVMDRHAGQPVA